ncbi:hypothetical protein [Niabella sp.]|uniref:hypothetical protein n=1 Tax=Niabella sp. TaxID=1962976 RepID=UPI00261A5D0A|nr:hypothetical protein [Niabella sp.]
MKKVFLLYGLLSLCFGRAGAQDMLSATIANIAIHDFQRERIRSEYEQEKIRLGRGKSGAAALKDSRSGHAFLFAPDTSVSVGVAQAIINDLKKKNPVSGNNLEAALKRNNPFPAYVRYLKGRGLDVQHDYADAFSAYLLGIWRIANGRYADPAAAQIHAVRNQVGAMIHVSDWSNQKKQEAAEYLLYDLIFANEPYEASRKEGNKIQQQQDSDMVYNRFLKQHKMDLRKMMITEKGLVPVK